MKFCIECGAPKPRARGRCDGCYRSHLVQLKEEGAFVARRPARTSISAIEKVLSKTTPGHGGCVIFVGNLSVDGYGLVTAPGERSRSRAHRVAYEYVIGPIPAGCQLDHLCHTQAADCQGGSVCWHRRCVNPYHLEPVTPRENNFRGLSFSSINARKTHCPQGHPYSPENTIRHDKGRRCRTCVIEQRPEWERRRTQSSRNAAS